MKIRLNRRDPRFLIGLFFVVAAAAMTVTVIYYARATVPVYQAKTDIAFGEQLTQENVELVNLPSLGGRYLVAEQMPKTAWAARSLQRGELIGAAAVSENKPGEFAQTVIRLAGPLPKSARVGTQISLWLVATNSDEPAQLLADDAVVAAIPEDSAGNYSVQVRLPVKELPDLLAASANDAKIMAATR
ncbi:MAG: hypothetical protein SOS98_03495 [Varibaculum sp.]|nr:hypothetical protein [Varibaculum sp.]